LSRFPHSLVLQSTPSIYSTLSVHSLVHFPLYPLSANPAVHPFKLYLSDYPYSISLPLYTVIEQFESTSNIPGLASFPSGLLDTQNIYLPNLHHVCKLSAFTSHCPYVQSPYSNLHTPAFPSLSLPSSRGSYETGEPRGNLRRHRENMQTPHREDPGHCWYQYNTNNTNSFQLVCVCSGI
uniref:Uncharacterized protein n=1 Tax=Pygocentrus nattereri TaxID=42514 RepID=A0AAR2M693_PYGNA